DDAGAVAERLHLAERATGSDLGIVGMRSEHEQVQSHGDEVSGGHALLEDGAFNRGSHDSRVTAGETTRSRRPGETRACACVSDERSSACYVMLWRAVPHLEVAHALF